MITVFGSVNLDLIFALDRLPGPGETLLGPGTRIEPGGKGANQAAAAALDGAAVAMVGAVGRDALAEGALASLHAAGVECSGIARVAEATGCAAICTDPAGRNLIAVGSGANRLARASQVPDSALGPGHTVLLQMEVPAAETTALIRRAHGARIILNLAPALPLDTESLSAVHLLVVNEHEAVWLGESLGTGPAAIDLHRRLGATVVRTLGEAGSEWADTAGQGRLPAYPVQATDTTAAGDCFTGVMAAALDRGAPLDHALRRASVAAALCCTRPGSQRSLPRAAETDAALAGR